MNLAGRFKNLAGRFNAGQIGLFFRVASAPLKLSRGFQLSLRDGANLS